MCDRKMDLEISVFGFEGTMRTMPLLRLQGYIEPLLRLQGYIESLLRNASHFPSYGFRRMIYVPDSCWTASAPETI